MSVTDHIATAMDKAVNDALRSQSTLLLGAVGGHIYRGAAPSTAPLPVVVYHQQDDREENLVPVRSITFTYLVKAIGEGGKAALVDVLQAMDSAMFGLQGQAVGSWKVFDVRRLSGIDYEEAEIGGRKLYQHVGSLWKVRVEGV